MVLICIPKSYWLIFSFKGSIRLYVFFGSFMFSALFLKSVEYSRDFLQVSIFHVQEFYQGPLRSADSRGTVMFSSILPRWMFHSPAPVPGQALVHRGNF